MTSTILKNFCEELEKFTTEELNQLHSHPFAIKVPDITKAEEALEDNGDFFNWFKLMLPTVLFKRIEKLENAKN
jgi:hypothetical protein